MPVSCQSTVSPIIYSSPSLLTSPPFFCCCFGTKLAYGSNQWLTNFQFVQDHTCRPQYIPTKGTRVLSSELTPNFCAVLITFGRVPSVFFAIVIAISSLSLFTCTPRTGLYLALRVLSFFSTPIACLSHLFLCFFFSLFLTLCKSKRGISAKYVRCRFQSSV